jgi:2-octaprenyl-6-methoxyphenol hydroxylase
MLVRPEGSTQKCCHMIKKNFDVVIVGGGLIGISLAMAFAGRSVAVGLVEANSIQPWQKITTENDRVIALSYSSRLILDGLGVWNNLKPFVCPMKEIHVSDRGHFGAVQILAQQEKVPALGYVIPANKLTELLQQAAQGYQNIQVFQPAEFVAYEYMAGRGGLVKIRIGSEVVLLKTQLLVAADGQKSGVRKQQGITCEHIDYGQSAIICNVGLKRSHYDVAYERFTEWGAVASLPLLRQRVAIVATINSNQVAELLELNDQAFLLLLQKCLGYRLGRLVTLSARNTIPLQLIRAKEQVRPGLVLLGNAAHTLPPIAGQGLNLGLRDMAMLAEEIIGAIQQGGNPGEMTVLQRYLARRSDDQQRIVSLTHHLVCLFANNFMPVVHARNFGLVLLDNTKLLKQIFSRRMMGLAGKASRLVSGLPLVE